MKIKTLITLFMLFCAGAKAQQTILYPTVKRQLDSMAMLDIKAGNAERVFKPGVNRDSLRVIFRKITSSNAVIAKQLFNQYGFLNYDMVGKESSNRFWLIVQHADSDVPFQEAVLIKMKEQVLDKKADGSNFAFLTDRVNVNTCKPQVYGTQLTYTTGQAEPKIMIDPENVDKRRKEVGLEPLADYLKFIREGMK